MAKKKNPTPTHMGAAGHDPAAAAFLIVNPRVALPLPLPLRLLVQLVSTLADRMGFWRFPRKMEGCFETMSMIDTLYWIYKSADPIRRAEKGSSVEAHFLAQSTASINVPEDFTKATEISLAAVGDLMENALLANSAHVLYEKIADELFTADISFANLEVPLTTKAGRDFVVARHESPPLNLTDQQFAVLKGHRDRNYTVMATSSNHSWDYGEEGALTTLERLTAEGIAALGSNRNREDQAKATILDISGLKIGMIGMTFGLNKSLPPEKEFRINRVRLNSLDSDIDLSLPLNQIRYCRECGCDFIIGSLHWGLEYEYYPAARQIETAHALVEAGLDLIIGHHPHIVQPVEYYRPGRDPDRTVVIAYSLGNLVSPCADDHLALSFLLKVTLASGTRQGRKTTLIENCRVLPVCQQAFMDSGKPMLRLIKVGDLTRFHLPFELPG